MDNAYAYLIQGAMAILGLALFVCLFRAVKGPSTSDRIIAVNMIGTITMLLIVLLALLMKEGYLMDIALIYAMLSFLAVVLLTKVFMGIYREKRRKAEEAEKNA